MCVGTSLIITVTTPLQQLEEEVHALRHEREQSEAETAKLSAHLRKREAHWRACLKREQATWGQRLDEARERAAMAAEEAEGRLEGMAERVLEMERAETELRAAVDAELQVRASFLAYLRCVGERKAGEGLCVRPSLT